MNLYALIVLVALLGDYLLSVICGWLNVRAMTPTVPDEFQSVYDGERYTRSQAYARTYARFGLLRGTFNLIVLLAFWHFGGFAGKRALRGG